MIVRRVSKSAAFVLMCTAMLLGAAAMKWRSDARVRKNAVVLRVGHVFGETKSAAMTDVGAKYMELHPDVRIVMVPVYPHRASEELHDGAHLVIAAREDVSTEPGFVPLFLGGYMALVYDRARVPNGPKTWDDIVERASKLNSEGLAAPIGLPEEVTSILPVLSPVLLSTEGTTNEKEAAHIFRRLGQIRFGLGLAPQNCSMACVAEKLRRRELAYALVSSSYLNDLRAALGDSLGVAPVPGMTTRAPDALATVYGVARATGLSNAEAAAARSFVDYIHEDQNRVLTRALGESIVDRSIDEGRASGRPASVSAMTVDAIDDRRKQSLIARVPDLQSIWSAFNAGRISPNDAAHALALRR